MAAADPSTPAAPAGRRGAVALALIALGLLLATQRWHTRLEPLDRDVATYAVIGREMVHGRLLYTDLFDHKPPLIYAGFALAQVMAGDGSAAVYLLGLACGMSTLLAVFTAGCAFSGRRDVGLLAAAFWTVVGGDLRLQANLPSGEALINACLPWALALLAGGSGSGRVLLAGAAIALASLFKPFVALHAASLMAVLAMLPAPGRTWREALRVAILLPLAVALAWLATGGYFAAQGRFGALWKALVVYNEAYAGGVLANLLAGLTPERLLPEILWPQLPLVALAGIGSVLLLCAGPARGGLLNLLFLATTLATVAAPGKFFPHYYQLWLPPLCIAAALGTAGLSQRRAAATGGAVLLVLGMLQAPSYRLGPEDWSRKKYGDVFVEAARTGRAIDTLLAPEETFFQWGIEPSLYYYSGRRPPAGVLWSQDMLEGPLRLELRTRTLEQLSAQPPELFVVWREIGPPRGALGEWFKSHYASFPPPLKGAGFSFWYRSGGTLEKRLRSGGQLERDP